MLLFGKKIADGRGKQIPQDLAIGGSMGSPQERGAILRGEHSGSPRGDEVTSRGVL